MAVILRSNLHNLLIVVFLIAAYSLEVSSKPRTESPENGMTSNDIDKTTKPTPAQAGFYIELDPQSSVQKDEESKKLKPVQDKKVEGSSENSKTKNESSEKKLKKNKSEESPEDGMASNVIDKTTKPTPAEAGFYIEFDPQSSVQKDEESKNKKVEGSVEKSKSKKESSEKKSKKNKSEEAPEDVAYDSYDEMQNKGWDLSELNKHDSDNSAEGNADTAVDSASSAKDKEAKSSKKSKVSKSESKTAESEETAEPLPSAQGQKSHPEDIERPTTVRPTVRPTTEPSTGSAATNLPRALCSFIVTVTTVMLVL